MRAIAHIRTDFKEKFGIPRQGGLISSKGKIVFEKEFIPACFDGLDEFSHIWVVWEFSENKGINYQAKVKPPKLGGIKKGVFATRSPFRPNPIGLSCVKLEKIETDSENRTIIYVAGVDMLDNTPVLDIKPYIPYADCHLDADDGFTDITKDSKSNRLEVEYDNNILDIYRSLGLKNELFKDLTEVLSLDPRPAYDRYEDRVYGMLFADFNIKFTIKDNILTIKEVERV